jgi:hypothetical protein
MTSNMGSADACIRWVVAMVFGVATVVLGGSWWAALATAAGAVFAGATALTRSCPLYDLVGWSTTGSRQTRNAPLTGTTMRGTH